MVRPVGLFLCLALTRACLYTKPNEYRTSQAGLNSRQTSMTANWEIHKIPLKIKFSKNLARLFCARRKELASLAWVCLVVRNQ
jgi:hypothetical protein